MVIDPLGEIVVEASTGEIVMDVVLDSGAVLAARRVNPALRNRRYGVAPL
jgi:predicted amidohydrolase